MQLTFLLIYIPEASPQSFLKPINLSLWDPRLTWDPARGGRLHLQLNRRIYRRRRRRRAEAADPAAAAVSSFWQLLLRKPRWIFSDLSCYSAWKQPGPHHKPELKSQRKQHLSQTRNDLFFCLQANTAILEQLIQLRAKVADLLGYGSHAEYVLEMNMAKNPSRVSSFIGASPLMCFLSHSATRDETELTGRHL